MKKMVVALISFSLLLQPAEAGFKKDFEVDIVIGVIGLLSVVNFAFLSRKEAKIQKNLLEGQFSERRMSELRIIIGFKLLSSLVAICSSGDFIFCNGSSEANGFNSKLLITDKKSIAITIMGALGSVVGLAGIISTIIQRIKFLDQMEKQKENERSSQEKLDSEDEFYLEDEAKVE